MTVKYPHVFRPIKLGPVEIPNRFFFSPHGVHLTVGSKPSTDYVAYQAARAAGGCGLIVCSMTVTERARHTQPSPFPAENIPSFRALADAIHETGGKIFAQVWYNWITQGHWQGWSPSVPPISASVVQFGINERTASTHEMTRDEIRAIGAAMRQSVHHLTLAGFDGIMLHGSHGGMIEQFLSPYFNRRADEYGGSLKNRMRFLLESLDIAREATRGNLAVGMRFNCDEIIPGGYGLPEAREILSALTKSRLLDFVDLDVAIEPNQLHLGMPPVLSPIHVYKPYVEAVRDSIDSTPVLSVLGRLTSVAEAEDVIDAGLCDMVGAARALIAEPELLKNAYENNEASSRTCIACNWCLMAPSEGAQGCTINPASYRERTWGTHTFAHAAQQGEVVVVGAGPAGLEAARVSALKGHNVTLIEERDELGGALALWAKLPGREVFQSSIDWWGRELDRLGVKIRLNTRATAATVLALAPDAVIVATGARYSAGGRSILLDADIPGHDQDFVYRPEDILLHGKRPTGKVVLLDAEGLHTSVGIAELLGRGGARVEYLMPGFSPVSPRLTGTQELRFIMERFRQANVTLSPTSYIRSIDHRVVSVFDVFSNQQRLIFDVDAVVLVTGREPRHELSKELHGQVSQLFVIGDALAARVLAAASYEGHQFARYIGEPDAPTTFSDAFFRRNPVELTPQPAENWITAIDNAHARNSQ